MPPSLPPFLPPCRAVETRITQEALRRHVLRVLRTWRERYVFSDDYLNGLQVRIYALIFRFPSTGTFAVGVNHPTITGNQHISCGVIASFDEAKPRLSHRPLSSNLRSQSPPLPPHHQKSMTVQLPQRQTLRPRHLLRPSDGPSSARSWRS